MDERIAGIDVHSKKTFWVIEDMEGNVMAEFECPTKSQDFLKAIEDHRLPKGTRVGLESGCQARWIHHLLTDAGLAPEVLSPQDVRSKCHRRGRKSDRRDAFDLCDGLRRDIFSTRVWVPSAAVCRLRQVLSRRRHFVGIRVREINAVKGLLKTCPDTIAPAFLNSEASWDALASRHANGELGWAIETHRQMWALANAHVAALDKKLAEALEPFADLVELLRGAPGVGRITAATFIATLGDPERFEDSGRLAGYLGLAPTVYDSGERQRRGSITKEGSPALRAALCEAAQQARKTTNPLNPYFLRVKAKAGYKTAIIAVAHRLARILYQMWRRDEPFDWRRLNVRYEVKTQTWTNYYHIGKADKA